MAIYLALLEWSRAAELTSDRASAIVTGEPLVLCRTLMRMAGGPVKDLDLDAFIRTSHRVRRRARSLRPLFPFLLRDHHDPPVPGAPGA